ncbi:MAG: ribonuclease catalytic domain-containing protein, partial [Desulfovibrionaceae bacterium]|nr:ribonuclease catalytic domain-containing protein [Desulfovibrionaceae bacterium]
MQGNQPLQAWVLEEREAQLRLYTVHKRELKLSASRLLPWSGPVYAQMSSRADMQSRLEEHRGRRNELAAGVDVQALWELVQGEEARGEAFWLAGFLWPDPDADQVAALGQALLARKTHFKFSPPFFDIFTALQVEQRLERQAREERQQGLLRAGAEFFRKLHEAAGKKLTLAAEDLPSPEMAEDLRNLLLSRIADPEAHDPDNLWKMLVKGLGERRAQTPSAAEDDPHLPLRLAVSWGILPEHHNYMLDQAGYAVGEDWADAESLSRLRRETGDRLAFLPETPEDLVSIDPASTRDWDDALGVSAGDGHYTLTIAIACPALAWPFGSALDKSVLRRASSLYLPEGDLCMLPEAICRDLFSLEAGEDRPALLLRLRIDERMNILDFAPVLSRIRLRSNIALAGSEAVLADEAAAGENGEAGLKTLYRLALILRKKRLSNGAIITEREDQEISLERDGQGGVAVRISPGLDYGRSHALVGEFMILYNALLAEWGRERGIPLIYRVQTVSSGEHSGVWSTPLEISRALQGLPPAKLSVEPRPHAGVGLPLYSSFTSPLRRYLDLLNQGQIVHYLTEGRPRLIREELSALLPLVGSRLESVNQIQRFRTRYWKLVYLQQEQKRRGGQIYWPASIIDEIGNQVGIHLDLPDLYLRGQRALFGERVQPGARIRVRLGKISLLRNDLQIMEVTEE